MVNESNISKLVKDSNLNTKLATLATKVDFFGDNSFQNVYQPTLDKLELKKDKGNKCPQLQIKEGVYFKTETIVNCSLA